MKFIGQGLVNIIQNIGHVVAFLFYSIGSKAVFICTALVHLFLRPIYWRNILVHFKEIAFFSIPIVGLTSFFTGMVLALQSYLGFSKFGAESAIANIVVLSITRELGPVLTALMVAGRISGAMAAEIGTMRVSEQIDALSTMNVNPIKYLVTPRIIAGILALPLLVLLADIIGVFGGFLISTTKLEFNSLIYLQTTWQYVTAQDVYSGLVKAAVFGFIITSMGCFFGYNSSNGAMGVGKSTTNAVVISCILIFFADYLLTLIFF